MTPRLARSKTADSPIPYAAHPMREATAPQKGASHSCHAHSGRVPGRPHAVPAGSKIGNFEAAFGRVARGGAVRPLRLALDFASCARSCSGVRPLGARLLAHLEAAVRDRLGRGGCVERHLGPALWRGPQLHPRHLERGRQVVGRVGAACVIDSHDCSAAGEGAVACRLADRVEAWSLGRLASDLAGLRAAAVMA